MTTAITDDVTIKVRIASFYPLETDVKQEIAEIIAQEMVKLGHKNNFIVYKTSIESKGE